MVDADAPTGPSFKERLINGLIKLVIGRVNKDVNVADLQRQHNAYQAKVVKITVTDLAGGSKSWDFRVRDGKVEYLTTPKAVDGGVLIKSDAFIALVRGKRKWTNPATGESKEMDYTPIDAVHYGEASYWGAAATNDVLLLARSIYKEVFPAVREDLGGSAPTE